MDGLDPSRYADFGIFGLIALVIGIVWYIYQQHFSQKAKNREATEEENRRRTETLAEEQERTREDASAHDAQEEAERRYWEENR